MMKKEGDPSKRFRSGIKDMINAMRTYPFKTDLPEEKCPLAELLQKIRENLPLHPKRKTQYIEQSANLIATYRSSYPSDSGERVWKEEELKYFENALKKKGIVGKNFKLKIYKHSNNS